MENKMSTKEIAASMASELLDLFEDAVDSRFSLDQEIIEYASNSSIELKDIKDADVIEAITPLFQNLVLAYLESARLQDEE